MSDTGSNPTVIEVPEGAVLKLPGSDKPTPVANVLTRDQHLAAQSQQADRLRNEFQSTYGEAIAIADVLQTPDGAEQLMAALAEQGYGKSIFDTGAGTSSGDDTGKTGRPSGQAQASGSSQVDASLQTRLAEIERMNAALMQTIANFEATHAVEKEIAAVRTRRPDADIGRLSQLAMQKRNAFDLNDALAFVERDELEERVKALETENARLRISQSVPGLDLFPGEAPQARHVVTNENRRSTIEDIVRRAAVKAQSS